MENGEGREGGEAGEGKGFAHIDKPRETLLPCLLYVNVCVISEGDWNNVPPGLSDVNILL